MQTNLTLAITTLTLVSNIGFALVVLVLLFDFKFRRLIYDFVYKNVLTLLFVTTLGALIGSLAYSNFVGYPPCELCWIQRIFMYPQSLLSFMAIVRRDKSIIDYLLPLSILGALVAFYHSLVHWGVGVGILECTASAGECAKVYVLEYGYITIPFMAFSSFVYLIGITVLYYLAKNGRK